jgi:hypothetical protein
MKDIRRNRNTHSAVYECQTQVCRMFVMIAVLRASRTHLPCRGFRTLEKIVGGEGLASGIDRTRFTRLCPGSLFCSTRYRVGTASATTLISRSCFLCRTAVQIQPFLSPVFGPVLFQLLR